MEGLRILPPILNFIVIAFIGLKTLGTECFSGFDISLSLSALIISVLTEIYLIKIIRS